MALSEPGKAGKKRFLRQFAEKLLKLKMERLKYGEMESKPVHFYLLMNVWKR